MLVNDPDNLTSPVDSIFAKLESPETVKLFYPVIPSEDTIPLNASTTPEETIPLAK